MTDLANTTDLAQLDEPSTESPKLTERSGLWRMVSLCAILAAIVITALAVLQARQASDVAMPDRSPVALETTTVTVTGLPTSDGTVITVLGLPASESRRSFDGAGTEIELPADMAALVQLSDESGAMIGLSIVRASDDRLTTDISALSTARALVVLSPGVLRPNLAEAFANLAVIEDDPAFEKLVAEIATNPNLSVANEAVEQAYAEIADRLPAHHPEADQGCDSVLASDAYPSAGTCVQPQGTGLVITNEQDRWVLVYGADDDEPCATIPPTNVEGSEVLIPSEQCTGNAALVAPGPVTNQGEGQPLIDMRVRSAAAVNILYSYAGPFADLAGGSAGFTSEAATIIRQRADDVVSSLSFLIDSNEEFAAATDVSHRASTALDRHIAAISAARLIIDTADPTAIIPHRAQGDDDYIAILDFFMRAGERMVATRTDWRWEADAVGMADFGSDT